MINVQEALLELLTRNTTISTYVVVNGERRIYPQIAREFTAEEDVRQYMTYAIISRDRVRTILGPQDWAHTRLQLDIYSRSYSVGQELSDAVSSALDGFRGEVVVGSDRLDVASVELESVEDLYEESTDSREISWHRVSVDLLIWHEMSRPAVASTEQGG